MDIGELHLSRVLRFVDGFRHGGEFDGASIDDCGLGEEMMDCGQVKSKRKRRERSRIRFDSREGEGCERDMVRRMENEDALSAESYHQPIDLFFPKSFQSSSI